MEEPDYWVCISCGGRDSYGSHGGCPHCGSQDEIIPNSVRIKMMQGKLMRRAGRGGWIEIDFVD